MSAADWPWAAVADPAALWAAQPTFVVGQALFVGCALAALVHALRAGRGALMIWVAALVAGTANDFIFMALPLVDNFWQAQGLVMLTPRMPLYIPCVYVCFMYLPTVTARRWGRGRWQTLALSGLPDSSSSVGVTVQVTSSPLLNAPDRLAPVPRAVPLSSVHSIVVSSASPSASKKA